MKNLLSIFALLVYSLSFGQDLDFITSINNTNISTAKTLANDIVSQSTKEYQLLKTSEQSNRYRFIYIPGSIAPEDFKQSMSYDKALIIDFRIIRSEGKKTLKLARIKADYNDVFPTWKKYFNNEANVNNTLTDYKSQRVSINNYRFQFRKEMGFKSNVWSIQNQS
jgi:hypothetical protein